MSDQGKHHFNLRVTGKVQGVWYRKSACQEALRLGIQGYVQNLADGSVHIEAEGERKDLEAFTMWCRTGPPMAEVDTIHVDEGPMIGYQGFVVRKDSSE